MAYQSTSNLNAFIMGSCRLAVPSSSGGYVHLGAARGVKLTETWENVEIEADNIEAVQYGIKNQELMVEGTLIEFNLEKFSVLRQGLDTWSTATVTFDSGGAVTITPQAFYLTHNSMVSSSESVTTTIYFASIQEGLTVPFPGDDSVDVAEIPFKLKGTNQSTRTVGAQLYNIVDTRSNVYVGLTALATTAP